MNYRIFLKTNDLYNPQQYHLWNNNLKNINEGRTEWFYEQSPAGKPITVLAESEDGRIVGSCSLYIRDMLFKDKKIKIGIASDFAVDRKHRVFGPALKMQRLLIDEGLKQKLNFIFAYPNNNSRGLFERVGFEKLGKINSGIKIVKSHSRVYSKLRGKNLSLIISYFLDKIFCLSDVTLKIIFGRGYNIQPGYITDKDYDLLWESAKHGYPIIGEKDSNYLKWRYLNNPSKEYFFTNAFNKTGELKGFIIYSIQNEIATLEELFVHYGDSKTTNFLLAKFVMCMHGQSIGQIKFDYLGNLSGIRELKKFLFYVKPGNRFCLIQPGIASCDDKELLLNEDNWFLFESEMDI